MEERLLLRIPHLSAVTLTLALLPSCADPSAQGVGGWAPIELKGHVGRSFAGGVWTGEEMLVWGGKASGTVTTPGPTCNASFCGRGAAYSPATDTWRDLSTTDTPVGRSLHSATWTGTEMIVWGGLGLLGAECPTGGAYNPSLDTWRPVEPQGVAHTRVAHTAVWTGAELIIFGGYNDGTEQFAAPEAYDPATDTWRALPTEGAPAARKLHASVWTGSEVLVWGGFAVEGLDLIELGNGGAYDPTTNTWRPLPASELAPTSSYECTVWTGTEMIVWDGRGAAYDPASDSWRAIASDGAPPARGQQAVWTGERMIVWGGGEDSGGAYDPATDSWVRLSARGEPAPRKVHQMHWTDSGMVVFGGLTPPEGDVAAPPPDCIFTF